MTNIHPNKIVQITEEINYNCVSVGCFREWLKIYVSTHFQRTPPRWRCSLLDGKHEDL